MLGNVFTKWIGFCICSSVCYLSVMSSFGIISVVSGTVVISGVTVSVLGCRVRSFVMLCWAVLILMWNAGPSRLDDICI